MESTRASRRSQHAPARKVRNGVPTRSAEDWEEAALDAIAARSFGSLNIPALAESLGVTKGSFYWHFDGLGALIAASLKRWQAADERAIEELEKIADPAERLRAAFHEAMELKRPQALYVTLSATPDPDVVRVLRQVSRRRLRFLTDAFAELGLAPSAAHERALLTYAAYIGIIHLRKQGAEGVRSGREVEAYVAHAAETLIPS